MTSISETTHVSKHTPGPWHVHKGDPERTRDYHVTTNLPGASSFGCSMVAKVLPVSSGNHHEANACLIAAAPTMYEALTACWEALRELAKHPAFEDDAPEFNEGGVGYEAAEVARAAIADAQGGAVSEEPNPFSEIDRSPTDQDGDA